MITGIRRNDYIASIRSDIADINIELQMFDTVSRQCEELIQYCKDNHLWKFKRVVKREYRLLLKRHKWQVKHKRELSKLLYLAERYTPGAKNE